MQILFISHKHFSIKRKWKNAETYAVYILHTWLPKFLKTNMCFESLVVG
jgi:hypothetical protein